MQIWYYGESGFHCPFAGGYVEVAEGFDLDGPLYHLLRNLFVSIPEAHRPINVRVCHEDGRPIRFSSTNLFARWFFSDDTVPFARPLAG